MKHYWPDFATNPVFKCTFPFITSFIPKVPPPTPHPQFLPRHYNPSRPSAPPKPQLPSLSSCSQLACRRRALWLTHRASRGGGEPDSLALSCGVWGSRGGGARHFWPYISTMWTGVRRLPTTPRLAARFHGVRGTGGGFNHIYPSLSQEIFWSTKIPTYCGK